MRVGAGDVLDASALLAWLIQEPGFDVVEEAMVSGVVMSVVNWAEVLSKLADACRDPDDVTSDILRSGIAGSGLAIIEMSTGPEQGAATRPLTRPSENAPP